MNSKLSWSALCCQISSDLTPTPFDSDSNEGYSSQLLLVSAAPRSHLANHLIYFFYVFHLRETSPQVFWQLNFVYPSSEQISCLRGWEFLCSQWLRTSVSQFVEPVSFSGTQFWFLETSCPSSKISRALTSQNQKICNLSRSLIAPVEWLRLSWLSNVESMAEISQSLFP